VRLWDAITGAALAILSGHEDLVTSAAFSPDGSHVLSASNDMTARIWPLEPINMTERNKRRDYICRERLIGAQSFSDEEMRDPILLGREELHNP